MNRFVLTTWLQTKLPSDEDGASPVEYILLAAMIVLAVIAVVIFMRTDTVGRTGSTGH
jgi:Flp pilus assembly pilin Flp